MGDKPMELGSHHETAGGVTDQEILATWKVVLMDRIKSKNARIQELEGLLEIARSVIDHGIYHSSDEHTCHACKVLEQLK